MRDQTGSGLVSSRRPGRWGRTLPSGVPELAVAAAVAAASAVAAAVAAALVSASPSPLPPALTRPPVPPPRPSSPKGDIMVGEEGGAERRLGGRERRGRLFAAVGKQLEGGRGLEGVRQASIDGRRARTKKRPFSNSNCSLLISRGCRPINRALGTTKSGKSDN